MLETPIKSVRSRLYADIAQHLLDTKLVKQVDLYNNQFAHLDEESVIKYPCVLIEFSDIAWRQLGKHCQQGELTINLYVATRSKGRTTIAERLTPPATEYLELLDDLHVAMRDLRLAYASTFTRTASSTDHDHDDLIVNVETFRTVVIDEATRRQAKIVKPDIVIGTVTAKQ